MAVMVFALIIWAFLAAAAVALGFLGLAGEAMRIFGPARPSVMALFGRCVLRPGLLVSQGRPFMCVGISWVCWTALGAAAILIAWPR